MIGLATRGYLRRLICEQYVFGGPGPEITSAEVVSPTIKDASELSLQGSSIRSASTPAAFIKRARLQPDPSDAGAPSITGKVVAPVIRKAEEE